MNPICVIAIRSMLLATLALATADAAAQAPAQSFAELQPTLEVGQTVFITEEDSVRRIETDDSDWNGVLIGLGIGSLLMWPCANDEEVGGAGCVIFPVIGMEIGRRIDDAAIARSMSHLAGPASACFLC
jgi:hypothetical protein